MGEQPDQTNPSSPPAAPEAFDQQPASVVPPSRRYADGTRVLSADGQTLGEVVATYREHLIVERGAFFPTAMFVPFEAIAQAVAGDIILSLTAYDAHAQGWHAIPEDPPMPEPEARPASSRVQPAVTTRPTAPPPSPSSPPADIEPAGPAAAAATQAPAPTTQRPAAPTAPDPDQPAEVRAVPPPAATHDPARATPTTTAPPVTPRPALDIRTVAPAAAPSNDPAQPIEVQAMQPDASVPPPDVPGISMPPSVEPDAPAPSVPGIPGRRLTDAELWSLLEPRAQAAASEDGGDAEKTGDPPGGDTPPKTAS